MKQHKAAHLEVEGVLWPFRKECGEGPLSNSIGVVGLGWPCPLWHIAAGLSPAVECDGCGGPGIDGFDLGTI